MAEYRIPKVPPMDAIFVNYRRSDSASFVKSLVEKLSAHFPSEKLFHDKVSILVGENFVDKIDAALAECGAFISVIGKNWISELGETGPNRLFDVNDLVRIEIESAGERGLWFTPILLDGAQMPQPQHLPESIHWIRTINAITIDKQDIDRCLIDLVKSLQDGLQYARFQASERFREAFFAENFNERFADGKLKRKGDKLLCEVCHQYFDPRTNDLGSCSFHPDFPKSVGNAGAIADYAEIWRFPCCGKVVKGEITRGGVDVRPERTPGCASGMHRPYEDA